MLYDNRVIDCVPSNVISQLEDKFSITFPNSASEILAAESREIDGSVKYILKFQLEPNEFNEFISSFTKGIPFERYSEANDYRDMDLSLIPKWFLTPIQNGEVGIYPNAFGLFSILVDKTDMDIYYVYLHGTY